jgi:asparagine synthase (glutamine-hydrolysing)
MCGIFGAIGPQSRQLAERAVSLLSHRGPDAHGVFFDSKSGVSFGHTRLSIIDLTVLANQPLVGADGLVTITFNGEIYNFQELRAQLVSHYDFKSHGDTEVLIAAYLRWGYDMLEKLNGIFAFAIFDRRTDTVFIARDGVGVKPLYYSFTPTHFIFASEIKALLHVPDLNRDLDIQGISHYLSYLYSPGERTPFAHVRKLKPGCAMVLAGGKLQKYWQFYEIPIQNDVRKISVEDAKEELLGHLNTAVGRQILSDVPVGTFLSGGLDSTIITALAQKKQGYRPLDCFTIKFGKSKLDHK